MGKLDGKVGVITGATSGMHRRQLAHFSPEELAELNRLLFKARRPDR
jgi:hypothetical protein